MKIYHTSPQKITEINNYQGPFAGSLFFSNEIYQMSSVSRHLYSIDIDINDNQIIDVNDLYCEDAVEQIIDKAQSDLDLTLDQDEAEALLDASDQVWNHECEGNKGDYDWWLQGVQGRVAREKGFICCESMDEQGIVYIVNLIGLENILKYEGLVQDFEQFSI